MPRVQVIRVLADAQSVLTPNDIHAAVLAAQGRIDVVSVYRILGTLEEAGIVHHVGLGQGYAACRLADHSDVGLEHVVCRSCGTFVELVVAEETASQLVQQVEAAGYALEGFTIEVSGLCTSCRSASA